jgi:LPXTG-motif cell wall-anchored protein
MASDLGLTGLYVTANAMYIEILTRTGSWLLISGLAIIILTAFYIKRKRNQQG